MRPSPGLAAPAPRPARRPVLSLPLAGLLALGACAEGGDEERPVCEVEVQASHHFHGLISRPRFAAFPTTSTDTSTFDGSLVMQAGCRYELRGRDGALISGNDYALANAGTLSLLVPGRTTVIFRGAYGREGDTGHVFVTDRIGDDIGIYWGTRLVEGPADRAPFVGMWRVFTLHSLFAPANTPQDPDAVGLAFAGNLDLAADGSFSGSGIESEAGNLVIRGQADDFQAFANGRVGLEITFDPTTKPDYERGFDLGGRPTALFGVDGDFGGNDTAAGLIAMVKHRDPADYAQASLAGVYQVGLYTLFLRPDASGSDSAIGTLELVADGNFELLAENNQGVDFRYRGTYAATADGGLTFTVSGTNETWQGAFDQGYDTVLLLDGFKETRANGQIELSIGLALRLAPANS